MFPAPEELAPPITSLQMSWQPSANRQMLAARAELLAGIRRFFSRAGVLEVETPVCSAHATTDPALKSLTTDYTGPGAPSGRLLYLHTSPEFPMKRLLAAGSGPIYQICRVFRDGESGRFHNPEFTLLEWYRIGSDLDATMRETAELVNSLLPQPRAVERLSYRGAFQRYLGIDPHFGTADDLRTEAIRAGIAGSDTLALSDRDAWLDLLLTHTVEPHLGRGNLTLLYDYPATQAALARVRPGDPPVAERFELYAEGMELANGFSELADAREQRRRFESDLERRRQEGAAEVPIDENLLAALESGLPDCCGVALGVDRLLLLITGAGHIDEVLSFPLERA
jgi:lysyl-tRNA synthetase class 2